MLRSYLGAFGLLGLLAGLTFSLPAAPQSDPAPAEVWATTYSICAYSPDTKEWGVATASRALAVGNCVPWAKAGVGAIATQSAVNPSYGSKGLELLAEGKSPEEVVKLVTEEDKGKEVRQLAVLDAKGESAQFTGKGCIPWAGGKAGKNFVCVGNLLAGEAVVDEMAKAFEEAKGPFAWRLMAALEAGEKAGGDKRGKQAAAILVVRDKSGPGGIGDRSVDLRVDDHETPVQELARVLAKRIRKP